MSTTEQPKSKFAEFLASKKIDARRVRYASEALEKLQLEDRQIRWARKHKKAEASKAEGGEKKKARSGRPVTDRAMTAALSGKAISGPQKTRILRAVNHLLTQKKQEPVALNLLF
ncbi:MAG: hypothetical protein MUF64_19965 [Polyangiaceae bacterium]|jgi:hypothetical protein|nr:hypothetical protein [Polyangiaceae bacterium]